MKTKEILVFVYGTLQKEEGNHHVMGQAKYLHDAVTVDDFHLLHSMNPIYGKGFPIAIDSNGEDAVFTAELMTKIKGEVYSINEKDLANVRRLEGYPNWYDEKEITVCTSKGVYVKAIIYVQTPEKIHDGQELYFNLDGDFSDSWNIKTIIN